MITWGCGYKDRQLPTTQNETEIRGNGCIPLADKEKIIMNIKS
jgi:hypothetical protein